MIERQSRITQNIFIHKMLHRFTSQRMNSLFLLSFKTVKILYWWCHLVSEYWLVDYSLWQ